MWCPHCESDVAAEVEAGERRARCATCGAQIAARGTPANAARTREALQLLERWSRPALLDPFQTTPGERREPAAEAAAASPTPEEVETMADDHELDNPGSDTVSENEPDEPVELHDDEGDVDHLPLEPAVHGIGLVAALQNSPPASREETTMTASATNRRPERDVPTDSPAHSDVRDAITSDVGNDWVATAGQLLAYAGVAVLTVGTTLALWGHFGQHPDHVPTGWLVAAAGQMLLFLGIVTLVSSGVEENAAMMQRRFDRVVHRLERVEDELARSREQRHEPVVSRVATSHEDRRAA